jgi:glycosyltransferase involved in cell wall biosynthesis
MFIMRIALIAHCNFEGNSAMHVFSLATELQKFGHECCVLVPDSPETAKQHGDPTFRVMDYDSASKDALHFTNGAAPEIIHAWSPREHVRTITNTLVTRFKCPYVVHMEDNEEQIVKDELPSLDYSEFQLLPDDLVEQLSKPYRVRPRKYREFIEYASGYSCLIDRLMEFKPQNIPGVVFWPGFDAPFAKIAEIDRMEVRTRFGLMESDVILLYSGNVHVSNVKDIQRLYLAVALLRQRGLQLKLIRTGWNYADLEFNDRRELDKHLIDFGFVRRADIPLLVAISDILVQPGKSDPFNDYRFPSKLPEYLVSGRPVILPNSNIGAVLEDGLHVLKLYTGSVKELAGAILSLIRSPNLMSVLGQNSRKFALEHLTWEKGAKILDGLYQTLVARHSVAKLTAESIDASSVNDDAQTGPPPTARATFPVKLIAFYLPQFHPTPENSAWWGEGFTEWTNVVRGIQNFRYHQQPRLPSDFGFYDLRVKEVLRRQAELAGQYGLHGFCFYYYWFNGKRLLEKPLNLWLSDRGLNFPFCVCWANESWTRRWDGSEDEILIAQTHEEGDALRFIMDILPMLKDPRYIRVDGSPLLLVYRVADMKDPIGTVQTWRRAAQADGIDHLHLCAVQSFGINDPRPYGFDAAVEFTPPHIDRMWIDPTRIYGVNPDFKGCLEDYISVAMRSINHSAVSYIRYRGIFPRWDNTSRRGTKGHIFINESPKAYAQWLRFLVREAMLRREEQKPLIFINAWNEWAEGAYLEPDVIYGRSFLEVTYDALCEGMIDHVRGPTAERERVFTQRVSRVPSDTRLG